MVEAVSIIIPAHNEAAVIDQTLASILSNGEDWRPTWRIIVAANGCTDDTVSIIQENWPYVTVLDLPEPSKVNALKAAMADIKDGVVVVLDADITVSLRALQALVAPLMSGHDSNGAIAAVGRFQPNTTASDWCVRLFYQAWALHPYFDGGKFGGCYALGQAAHELLRTMPSVINDDEYVARQVSALGAVASTNCTFSTLAPRTVRELIRVRSRIQRGNRELHQMATEGLIMNPSPPEQSPRSIFLKRLLRRPGLWPAGFTYIVINALAKLRNRWRRQVVTPTVGSDWERVSR